MATVSHSDTTASGTGPKFHQSIPPWVKRSALWIGGTVSIGALAGIVFAASINVPKVDTLEGFQPPVITRLYDVTGTSFESYARERRVLFEVGEVPEVIRQAVLSAEDSNFFRHGGVDIRGVIRAVVVNLTRDRRSQGGSTLTMQLARRLFLSPERAWKRKIEEAFLSVEIEKNYSKEQILTFYCNLMNLGHRNYGMKAATRYYFDKEPAELEAHEAAMLAGILQRPADYSPYRNPEDTTRRRDYVLRRMRDESYLDQQAYEAAVAKPLEVVPLRYDVADAPYFAEEVRKDIESRYGKDALLESGLNVFTSMDPRIQSAVEAAVRAGLRERDRSRGWRGAHQRAEDLAAYTNSTWLRFRPEQDRWIEGLVINLDGDTAQVKIVDTTYLLPPEGYRWTRRRLGQVLKIGDVAWFSLVAQDNGGFQLNLEQQPDLEAAAVVIENGTGAVRGMVGGWDFQLNQFNRATQASRQVGSTFKAFVYGTALESGFTPADTIFDGPVVFPDASGQAGYSPRNFKRTYHGILTLRSALENSRNASAVKVLDLIGVERVIDFARRSGITSALPPYPSLALGASDLTAIELAGAFSTFANGGLYVAPYFIERVEDADGRQREVHRIEAHQATSPEVAYLLVHMLRGVVDRGTATSIRNLPLDIAGKTGTTNSYSDAWFAGMTPQYTIVVWVGYDQKRSLGTDGTGGAAALPIWRRIAERGLEEGWMRSEDRFVVPQRVRTAPIELRSGYLAGPAADQLFDEAFIDGTQPLQIYRAERGRILDLPWYQQEDHYLPKTGERMPSQVDDWSRVREQWEERSSN